MGDMERAKEKSRGMLSGLWDWMDRHSRFLLTFLLLGYFLLFSAASIFKLEALRQGFDLAGNEQTLWNTMHGRLFQTSVFFPTMRYDFDDGPVLLQLPLAGLYALYPSPYTLLILQTAVIALGALPLYGLARDLWGRPGAGLVAAALYLLHPTVQHINLYEFQYRSFTMTFALYAFYFFERRKYAWWALFLLLGMATKTESALLAVSFGLYALLRRRPWGYVWPPIVVGGLWFYLALFVVAPHFTLGGSSFVAGIYSYGYLGDSFGEILHTLVTRPLFVLSQLFWPEKVQFLGQMLFLCAFLPLLSPRELLLPAPIFFLNLLSPNPVQFSLYYQYQGLTVPFLLIAMLYGLHRLQRLLAGRGENLRPGEDRRPGVLQTSLLLLLLFGLANCLFWNNALWSTWRRQDTPQRIADARVVVARVPADAPLAASNFLAPFVARREGLYFFPGNRSYPFRICRGPSGDPSCPEEYFVPADYLLTDTSETLPEAGREMLRRFLAEGSWEVMVRQGDFILLRRVENRWETVLQPEGFVLLRPAK